MSFEFVEKVMCIGGEGTTPPVFQFYKRGFCLDGTGGTPSWQDIILSGNGSLSLTAALANGLNYLKLFGNTEQRNLPSGYTQVESITFDGSSYIDTGIKANSAYTYKFKVKRTSPYNSNIWGVKTNNSYSANSAIILGWTGTASIGVYSHEGADEGGNPYAINWKTDYHTIEFNPTSKKLIIDGVDIWSTLECGCLTNDNWSSDTYNLYLGGTNTVGSFVGGGVSTWAEYEVWDGGTLIQKLISCKNSSNVIGMYDTVSKTFLTNAGTGTFTAGADVTAPSPDTPIDIVCNNGVVKLSKNLFDKNQEVLEGWYNDTGALQSSIQTGHTEDYIYVKPNTIYIINQLGHTATDTGKTGVYFYDINKNWINRIASYNVSSFTFTTPSNCYYVKFQVNLNTTAGSVAFDKDTCQLEQGSTTTPYTPYSPNGIYTDGTVETINVHSKNLFDISTSVLGGLSSSDGSETVSTTRTRTGFIPFNSSATITISATDNFGIVNAYFYDANKNFITATPPSESGRVKEYTVSNNNASFIRVTFCVFNSSTTNIDLDTFKQSKIQIELGSTATSYEQYFNGGTAPAENLFKVGTYQDEQSVINGSVTRNIGVLVLDGTESWSVHATGAMGSTIPHIQDDNNLFGYCSHFLGVQSSVPVGNLQIGQFKMTSTSDSIYFKTEYSTTTDWTNWLKDQYNAGTPVIVVYPLATATTETVTGQPLSIQAGTNIVEITQASIDNLGLEVSYKATV